MEKTLAREAKKMAVLRISDANSAADLAAALQGAGMFGEKRAVVLDSVLANEEMRAILFAELQRIAASHEPFFILEGKLDAATRKSVEKHAESSEKFDSAAKVKRGDIFILAYALNRGDKKTLWIEYQRALARDEAPEAIHGVLFWGAKERFLKTSGKERERAARLVADLAELPHEARRQGYELEYALERYLLSVNKS
jgi:hypothetical protein